MQKIITSLLAIALTTAAFAQKVDLKKEQMLVDGIPVAKVVKVSNNNATGVSDVSVRNLETDKEIIFAEWHKINTETGYNGMQGQGFWWDILFLETKQHVEIEIGGSFTLVKDFLKMLNQNKLIKNGAIDPEAFDIFVTKYGDKRPFDRYRNPAPVIIQQPTTTVIVQQQPRSGINIGLGDASINIGGGNGGGTTSVVVAQGTGTSMAQRDRSQGITFQGSQIVQGGVLIGTFAFDNSLPAGSPTVRVIVLYPDGNKAGEGVVYNQYSNEGRTSFTLISGLNGSSRQINLRPGEMVAFQKPVVAAMVREGML